MHRRKKKVLIAASAARALARVSYSRRLLASWTRRKRGSSPPLTRARNATLGISCQHGCGHQLMRVCVCACALRYVCEQTIIGLAEKHAVELMKDNADC